jgi:hypothetical protein
MGKLDQRGLPIVHIVLFEELRTLFIDVDCAYLLRESVLSEVEAA